MIDLGPVGFLRPAWLLALLLPILPLALRRARAQADAWRRVVDPHLLPHLLAPGDRRRRRGAAWLLSAAWVLATLALAGPTWRQVEQPLWETRVPLVLAVDLSSATLAADLPPSRLARLRARLSQLLAAHGDGQVGLVAFAGDAFTVAPLTDDARNVGLFVDALEPSIMPVDGQAADRAIVWSQRLLERAGFERGRIVVVTDHADAAALQAAASAREAGFTVSALGLGTVAGAPVRTAHAGIATVRLDESSLRDLARAGGGRYAPLSAEGADAAVFAATGMAGNAGGGEGGLVPQDGGYWLLPPLLLLVLLLLVAQRGRGAALLLVACLAFPPAGRAADLWRRPDQQAHATMLQGVEAYRRGQFDRAAMLFGLVDTADGAYNRGNALAKAGQLREAVEAYTRALQLEPGMPDAIANRRAVLEALERQAGGGGQSADGGRPQSGGQRGQSGSGTPSSQPPSGGQPGAGTPERGRQAPPTGADPAGQARADAAQRARMDEALGQAGQARAPGSTSADAPPLTPAQRERAIANDAALRRVPDEPGNLLREKFRLEYERRLQEGDGP